MFKDKQITALPYLADHTNRTDINVQFPAFVPVDRIGVNVDRLHYLLNLGGIEYLQITPAKNQAQRSTPQIIGVTSQGGALAGKSGTADPESVFTRPSSEHANKAYKNMWHPAVWVAVRSAIRMDAVQQQLLNSQQDLRQPESWAGELDGILRNIIVYAGVRHLLRDLRLSQAFFAGFYLSLALKINAPIFVEDWMGDGSLSTEGAVRIFLNFMFYALVVNSLASIEAKQKLGSFRRARWNVLPAVWQADRAAWLYLYGQRPGLITTL